MISKAYSQIRGAVPSVNWRELVCHNCAEPRQTFILWLQLHGRLRTKRRLVEMEDSCFN